MFEKTRAIALYKRMVNDLIETKQKMEKLDSYDGFDRGFVLVPGRYVNCELIKYLSELAKKDNYNFSTTDVKHDIYGDTATLCVIDNETQEYKESKRFKSDDCFDLFFKPSIEKPTTKILSMEEYKKR